MPCECFVSSEHRTYSVSCFSFLFFSFSASCFSCAFLTHCHGDDLEERLDLLSLLSSIVLKFFNGRVGDTMGQSRETV